MIFLFSQRLLLIGLQIMSNTTQQILYFVVLSKSDTVNLCICGWGCQHFQNDFLGSGSFIYVNNIFLFVIYIQCSSPFLRKNGFRVDTLLKVFGVKSSKTSLTQIPLSEAEIKEKKIQTFNRGGNTLQNKSKRGISSQASLEAKASQEQILQRIGKEYRNGKKDLKDWHTQ